jgi:AbrB family looped-hinge helix DNA binding protein
MRTTIDKAGRLVIPREIRRQVGLAGGDEVDVEVDGAGIHIEPVAGSELVEKDGLLIIRGSPGSRLTDAMVRELIDADRYRR